MSEILSCLHLSASLLYPRKRILGGYIGNILSACLSRLNLTLAISFELIEIGLSYYTCVFLVTRPFSPYQNKNFDIVTLTLTFDLLLKKLNLRHNVKLG